MKTEQNSPEDQLLLSIRLERDIARNQLNELAEVVSFAYCNCTLREQESGHRTGCWKPDVDAALSKVKP